MAAHRVLVAEPDASQRQIMEMLLLVHGCEVTMALDAREALAFLRNNNPDLIVASTELPQMNGYDISRKTRGVKRLRNVPVILVAPEGTPLDEARTEAEMAGADLLMVKPLGDKNFGDRAVGLIRRSAESPKSPLKKRPGLGGQQGNASKPPQSVASVLDSVAASDGPAENDEVRNLRQVVKDLS